MNFTTLIVVLPEIKIIHQPKKQTRSYQPDKKYWVILIIWFTESESDVQFKWHGEISPQIKDWFFSLTA